MKKRSKPTRKPTRLTTMHYFIIVISMIIVIEAFIYLNDKATLAIGSYESACLQKTPVGLVVGGTTAIINGTATVTNYIPDCYPEIKIQVNKHENCHAIQYNEKRWGNCDKKLQYFSNEMECYIAQDLPDSIYNYFYHN